MNDAHDDKTPRTDGYPPRDGADPIRPSGPDEDPGGSGGDGYAPDHHPDLEQVAAFVEGRLSGDERRRMVAHLAACEDCHELMAETAELLRPDGETAGEEADGRGGVRPAGTGRTSGDAGSSGDPGTPGDDAPEAHPGGSGTAGPAAHPEGAGDDGEADGTRSGKVLRPAPGRWRRTFPLIAALAAASLAAVILWTPAGYDLRRGVRDALSGPYDGDPVPVASVVAPLPTADPRLHAALETVPEHQGWTVYRGEEATPSAPEALAFKLGVRNAELAAALAAAGAEPDDGAHHRSLARQLTARIQRLLEGGSGDYPVVDVIASAPWLELRRALEAGAPPEELIALHAQADRFLGPDPELDSPGFVDAAWYALGKWAGAALLAARAGELEWFLEDRPLALLHQLDRVDWPATVEEPLAASRKVLRTGPSEDDLPLLRNHLVELVAAAGSG